ncbi:MAG TPA: transglycosylase domain-containing protein, partial [Candidatus Saccharimonadales bacterium]|nr:transglycosylase domain-containing protein [Candidatus Saccharimonadales bacterium]
MKIKIKLPSLKFRSPFANPVNLRTIHQKFFGRKNTKERRRLTWKLAGRIALWGLGALVLITILTFAWFAKDLPSLGSLKNLTSDASTRLYDRNMNELYTISGEKKRIVVDSNQIPDNVKEATVALEDKNFYHEPGVDYKGVIRAVIFLGKRGGGSTLTQQYVKNALLTSQRTIPRKIKEAILSIELSFLYNKDQILTMYLNESPYGGNNYGIEAASKSYFGKSAKDLTLAEAATLAALPQRPTTYSPYGEHTDLLVARRNYCLDQMVSMGYIKQADADVAKATPLAVVPEAQSIVAPHFVMYVP